MKLTGSEARKRMNVRAHVGNMVRLGVWVCGEWQPMDLGKVTAIKSGYIEADVMGIHGGAPWIHTCQSFHYMLESEYKEARAGAGAGRARESEQLVI